jgi:hypothetical protein
MTLNLAFGFNQYSEKWTGKVRRTYTGPLNAVVFGGVCLLSQDRTQLYSHGVDCEVRSTHEVFGVKDANRSAMKLDMAVFTTIRCAQKPVIRGIIILYNNKGSP